MRYLDPKNDLTFKKVFGEHPHILKSFLNALLPLPEGEFIESLEYLSPELVPQVPLLKNTIVDVRCIDNKGRQFIVEMQLFWTASFKSRVLFNASKAYVKQLERTKAYISLQPVYALSLVNDEFETKTQQFYHHYQIVHTENSDMKIEGLEFVFIELPKFKPHNISEKKLQVLWLRYLTEITEGTMNVDSLLLQNPEINEAVEYLQESAFTPEELETYNRYWDTIRTEKTYLYDADKKGFARGVEHGEYFSALKVLRKGKTVEEVATMLDMNMDLVTRLKKLLEVYGDQAENHINK